MLEKREFEEGEEQPKIIVDWEPEIIRSARYCNKKPCKGIHQ